MASFLSHLGPVSHYIPTRIVARNVTIPLRVDSKTGETLIATDGREPERVQLIDYDKKSLLVYKIVRPL